MMDNNRWLFAAGMPTMIFTLGIPGAGKSTWCRQQLPGQSIIAADAFKRTHPAFDPARPDRLHQWSKVMAARLFEAVLARGRGIWVLDGIGADAVKLSARIAQARAAGFYTVLVYFPCRLELALVRNARRRRTIPPAIIKEKASTIDSSFSATAPYVDYVQVRRGHEITNARYCLPGQAEKLEKFTNCYFAATVE